MFFLLTRYTCSLIFFFFWVAYVFRLTEFFFLLMNFFPWYQFVEFAKWAIFIFFLHQQNYRLDIKIKKYILLCDFFFFFHCYSSCAQIHHSDFLQMNVEIILERYQPCIICACMYIKFFISFISSLFYCVAVSNFGRIITRSVFKKLIECSNTGQLNRIILICTFHLKIISFSIT